MNRPSEESSADRIAGDIASLYDAAAGDFDRHRTRFAGEEPYLQALLALRDPAKVSVLDLGCGTGRPIARHFIERGCALTGIDAAPAMIALCRRRFPAGRFANAEWRMEDMRTLSLGRRFDAIIAWDSFFHLPIEDQRAMFPVFARHAAPGARLLFTSGPKAGEAVGDLFGRPLYHASLDPKEYRALLHGNGFEVLRHMPEDPDCGGHTVWLACRAG